MSQQPYGHNKGIVYRAILLNRRFTLSQLCAWTNLTLEQAYPHVYRLMNDGFLETDSVEPAGDKRPAHRPLTLYKLTENSLRLAKFAELVAPFLRLATESEYES